MEVERGMAHIYGDPDPNSNVGQGFRDEPGRVPQSNAGTFGSDNTTGTGPGTGFTRTGEHEDYGRRGGVDKGVGTETSGYGSDDKRSQSGVQNLEQRPANGGSGLSPNRGPQNAGFEDGRSPMSQAGSLGGSGFTRTGEQDDYERGGGVGSGVGSGTGGYGSGDERGQSGVQNLEQRPATDRNTEMNPGADGRDDMSPNRGTQNAGFEDGRSPMSQAGSLGGTGFTRTGEHDDYERGGGVDSGVGRGTSGYGPGDEHGQSGVQNLERQPAIDRHTEMSPGADELSPNRGPQNAGFEDSRSPMSQAGSLGGTGFARTGEHDGYERGGGVDSGVGRGTSGYGPGDERAQSGVQNLEQQPAIDRNTEMSPSTGGRGGLSPNRSPQNAGFEEDRSSMSQGGGLSSIQQQKMRQDPPPALPPRPQAQATNDDQSGQMYQ